MNTYIIAIIFSYFLTRYISDKAYYLGKKYNKLTYPDQDSLFPAPVLYNYSCLIIVISTLTVFFGTVFLSPKFKNMFVDELYFFSSIFLVMIVSGIILLLVSKKLISVIILSFFNTYIISLNNINLKPELFGKYDGVFIFLWFIFLFSIFNREKTHVGTSFLLNSIILLTISMITFYVDHLILTNITLIMGISLLCIFRFSYSPTRILPGGSFSLWFASILGYISVISNIKLTTLSLLLIIPLTEIIDWRKGKKGIDISLLKKGIPEKKVNFLIMFLQIIFGAGSFFLVYIKNEIISFLIFIMLFIFLFIINNVDIKKNGKNSK